MRVLYRYRVVQTNKALNSTLRIRTETYISLAVQLMLQIYLFKTKSIENEIIVTKRSLESLVVCSTVTLQQEKQPLKHRDVLKLELGPNKAAGPYRSGEARENPNGALSLFVLFFVVCSNQLNQFQLPVPFSS